MWYSGHVLALGVRFVVMIEHQKKGSAKNEKNCIVSVICMHVAFRNRGDGVCREW